MLFLTFLCPILRETRGVFSEKMLFIFSHLANKFSVPTSCPPSDWSNWIFCSPHTNYMSPEYGFCLTGPLHPGNGMNHFLEVFTLFTFGKHIPRSKIPWWCQVRDLPSCLVDSCLWPVGDGGIICVRPTLFWRFFVFKLGLHLFHQCCSGKKIAGIGSLQTSSGYNLRKKDHWSWDLWTSSSLVITPSGTNTACLLLTLDWEKTHRIEVCCFEILWLLWNISVFHC